MIATTILRTASLACFAGAVLFSSACSDRSNNAALSNAKQALDKKEMKAAVILLKTALQKTPDSAEVRFLLGRALLESGDPAAGAVELRRALDLHHSSEAVMPLLVRALTLTGRAEQATNLYGTTSFPNAEAQAEMKAAVAVAWGFQGKREAMQQAIKEALAADPKHPSANVMAARYMAERGESDSAEKTVDDVLAREPGNASAWQLKGLLLRHVRANSPGAMAAFRKALTIDPTFLSAHSEVLSLLFEVKDKKGMREQIAALQKALPNNASTYVFRAQIEYLDGNLKGARELVQQVLRADLPDNRALLLASLIEYRVGSLVQVETYLTRILQSTPNHEAARRLLASTYIRAGQPTKALTALQPLLDSDVPSVDALGLAAEALLQSGNSTKAEIYFQRAAKVKPDDPRVRSALALSRIARGDAQVGFAELESVAASDNNTFADMALISANMTRNNLEAALSAVDRLEKKQPDKPLAPDLRGRILMQRNEFAAARASFERALGLDPLYFPAIVSLAALDINDKDIGQAKKRFEALLVRDPKNYRAMMALADLRTRNKEPRNQITELYQQAVNSDTSALDPRIALIEYHLGGRDYKLAVAAAQEALASFPNNDAVLMAMGRAQLGAQEYQQAITAFRKVAALTPQAVQPQLLLADAYWAKGEPAGASQSLKRALEISPNLLEAQLRQITLALAQKNYAEALGVARQIQKARSRDGVGFGLEANVLMEQKKWDEAAVALRSSLQRAKSSEAAIKLHGVLLVSGKSSEADKLEASWRAEWPQDTAFLFHLGDVAMSRREWGRAEERYRELIAIAPGHALAHNNIAWVLMQQQKPGALVMAQRANELLPGNVRLMDTLAAALADAGQTTKAMELQRKVVQADPGFLGARLTLARIAIKAGDKALARAELEKLAYIGDKFPSHADVAELMRTLQ